MAITYVTFNKQRQQWQYQRPVPRDLRALVGRTLFRKWLKEPPRADTPSHHRKAVAEAASLAAQHDKLFEALRAMPEAERAQLAAGGGYEGHKRNVPQLTKDLALAERYRQHMSTVDPRKIAVQLDAIAEAEGSQNDWDAGRLALWQSDGLRSLEVVPRMQAELERAKAFLLKVEPISEFSFEGLKDVWVKSQGMNWRGRTDNHQRTVGLLKEILGNIDYRDARQDDHAVRFRDALESRGSYSWQKAHLERASAMYAAAVNEGTMRGKPNPFSGIGPRGTAADADEDQTDLFTAAQLKVLLDTARKIKFGDTRREKRHTQGMWLLEVMAYSGMRPNEVLQLQRGDVYVEPESGVKVIHIRRTCCVTGKRHDEKSMKNPKLRDVHVPLHPKLDAFFDYANAGTDKAEFIFGCFPYTGVAKKRRGWFDTNFGKLLKECKITPKPGKKLSLYSIRRRFHRAMDNAKIDGKRQRVITSHAGQDVHDKYSRGAELVALAADVAKVDPLAS